MKKICFVSVVHPKVESYLVDFFNSLKAQTYKSFELILFNDGLDSSMLMELSSNLSITIIDVNGTPNEIRNDMISFLMRSEFNYCVFGDADDFFEKNRVEENLRLLKSNDIVVNDVHLISQMGEIIKENYFSKRMNNLSSIDFVDIMDKNIIGLGNSSIRIDILSNKLFVSNEILAVDWQVFSRLLLINKSKTIFTNNTSIFYRQYDGNCIGLDKLSEEKIKFIVNVKIEHFKSLSVLNKAFNEKLNTYLNLRTYLEKNENCSFYLNKLKDLENTCLFWWEEVKLLEEFDYENTNNSK